MMHPLTDSTDTTASTSPSYLDVFQHAHAMGVVGLCLLIGLLLFLGASILGTLSVVREAKRIQQARAAGQVVEKKPLPSNRRLIVPVLVLMDLLLIAAPVLYDAVVAQHQTVAAMQTNVKAKYGADLELVDVGPNQKLMQASSPDKPENYTLTFPDGTAGTYSIRFDKATSEPFILNSDGSVQEPAQSSATPPSSSDGSGADPASVPSPDGTE